MMIRCRRDVAPQCKSRDITRLCRAPNARKTKDVHTADDGNEQVAAGANDIDICHGTARLWRNGFGPLFAGNSCCQ
jgi:hypothetical protein